MAGISEVAKTELKTRIRTELEVQFGASELPATLEKYAVAMAEAISEELFKHNFWPDSDTYPPSP